MLSDSILDSDGDVIKLQEDMMRAGRPVDKVDFPLTLHRPVGPYTCS